MKDMDELLKIAIMEQYKELCDKIKIQVLTKLEEFAVMKSNDRSKMFITFDEIAYMRMELEKVRSKEHEREMRAIGGVINMILDRTDNASNSNSRSAKVESFNKGYEVNQK